MLVLTPARRIGVFGLAVCIEIASALVARAADDIPIGSPDVKYVDPEFDSARDRMTFQDGTTPGGSAWIGYLDPATGKLRSDTGKDHLVGTGVTSIWRTLQGPEWIVDAGRTKVFFTASSGTQPALYLTPALIGSPQPSRLLSSSGSPVETHGLRS